MTKEKMSKIDKIDLIKCFIKALIKSARRAIRQSNLRYLIPYRKIIKHAFGTLVIMAVIISMALPNSLAADIDETTTAGTNTPAVMSEEEALEASIREFTVYGMYLKDEETESQAVEATLPVGDIGNNGYPYAKKAEEGVTLSIKLNDGVAEPTYQTAI